MTRPSKPTPARPDLEIMVKHSIAAFEAMTPEQQREHRAAQRKSWVVGQVMLSNPNLSREEAEAIYERIV